MNNLIQELLGLLHQKPLNCRCGKCKSGEIVVCEKCWQLKPYCLSQPFDLVCNDCLKH